MAPAETDEHEHEHEEPPLIFQQLRPGVHGAAILGPAGSGKSSLAFQAAYALAGRHPERQAVFLHCRKDGRDVATAVRPLVGGGKRRRRAQARSSTGMEEEEEEEEDEHDQQQEEEEEEEEGGWDYGALENVFLKRFTTAQHLLWYLGSLHNQPDALLPGALIIDDLHRFASSAGHDLPTAASRVLSLLRDAAEHIRARTGRPCWLLVTMEAGGGGPGPGAGEEGGGGAAAGQQQQQQQYHHQQQHLEYAVRRLIPAFVRQLGAVFRLRRDRAYRTAQSNALPSLSLTPSSGLSPWGPQGRQQGQGQQGQGEMMLLLEEDPGGKLGILGVGGLEMMEGNEGFAPRRAPRPCRFLLGPRVLRLAES
jgi:hypothetical protein